MSETLESFQLLSLLGRIATALEEQNRFNQEWMALSKEHHAQDHGMALKRAEVDSRFIAIQEQNAERDQSYREEILHNAELQAKQTNEIIQASYEAYLESLKSLSKELVQRVQEVMAEDIRRSTGVRKHE